jgi:hypothetical protein
MWIINVLGYRGKTLTFLAFRIASVFRGGAFSSDDVDFEYSYHTANVVSLVFP